MNLIVYDFDGTIYDGDSSIDFYKFCFSKKKSICKYWFKQLLFLGLYLIGIKNKTEMKEVFFSFLKSFENPEGVVEEFWEKHQNKIKEWYRGKDHKKDVVLSASPEFLLKKGLEPYKVKEVIGSVVDIKTGKFLEKNCHGKEKVKRFYQKYPDGTVEEMYTDSLVDLPMIEIAKKGFMVEKNTIINYQDYHLTKKQKLKQTFLTPKFFRFVFVGCLNTFNGVLCSYLYSLVIKNATVAFIVGYLTSLFVSYFLNSYITFHDRNLGIKKFITFCISYIPNFLIQLICVFIFIDLLHFYKVIAYVVAALIGIPITFLALSFFTFKKKLESVNGR